MRSSRETQKVFKAVSQESARFLAQLGLESLSGSFSEFNGLGTLLLEGQRLPSGEAKALWQRVRGPARQAGWSCFLTIRSLAKLKPDAADLEADLKTLGKLKGTKWFEQARKRAAERAKELGAEFDEAEMEEMAEMAEMAEALADHLPPEEPTVEQAGPRFGALVRGEPGPDAHLVLYRGGPELAPIFYRFGGWNDSPKPAEQASVLRSWQERFGTDVAFVGADVLELVTDTPPATEDQVEAAAIEVGLFCSEASSHRANLTLVRSNCWFFWWD
ncbi:MAG TPA: DUF4253 domain-containing protein [Myxococcaceae bacterium]|jgi:hypothetical protein